MANTISNGTSTISPTQILGWESKQASRTILHEILNKSSHDVTMRLSSLRSGSLKLLFPSSSTADAARAFLIASNVFTLTSDEATEVGMTFVVSGDVSAMLDPKTLQWWIVSLDFQEVSTL